MLSLREIPGFRPGVYHMTSPPVVVDEVVIIGSAINDNTRVDMPSGVVRGFDARTGTLRWSWQPLAPSSAVAGERHAAHETFQSGAANAWSIMTVDPERNLVFVPTGSASPDYFDGLRPGDNQCANSVVALRTRARWRGA